MTYFEAVLAELLYKRPRRIHVMMTTILAVVAVVIAALIFAFRRKSATTGAITYARTSSLATPVELRFYEALQQALAPDECAMAKVRLIDVLRPTSVGRAFYVARAKVIQKHLDFVICDRATLAVRYAIEINDRSHEADHRQRRDEFLASAMRSVGIPLFFVPAQSHYDAERIRSHLKVAQAPRA